VVDIGTYCDMVEISRDVFCLNKDSSFLIDNKIVNPLNNDLCTQSVFDSASGLYSLFNSRVRLETDFFMRDSGILPSFTLSDVFCASICNAEKHGNKFDSKKKTTVSYSLKKTTKAGLLELCVRDEGEGFDYNHLLQAEEEARGTKRSYNEFRDNAPEYSVGYGLFGILRHCERVIWNEAGNEITMFKILMRR